MAEPFYIVFVCNGNTCRSPMAQGILRKLLPKALKPQFRVLSAGLYASDKRKATPEAVEVAGGYGVNLTRHQTRQVDDGLLEKADLVLTFSAAQRDEVARRCAPPFGVFALKEFGRKGEGAVEVTIADPVGGTKEAYVRCYQEIKEEIERILSELSRLWELKSQHG